MEKNTHVYAVTPLFYSNMKDELKSRTKNLQLMQNSKGVFNDTSLVSCSIHRLIFKLNVSAISQRACQELQ